MEDYPKSEEEMSPTRAQSSAARALNREPSPPTPGVDDTPYIRFALDQLTRDEEVRGSRQYAGQAPGGGYTGLGSGQQGNYPYIVPPEAALQKELGPSQQQEEKDFAIPAKHPLRNTVQRPQEEKPLGPGLLVPYHPTADSYHQPLTFLPGILRPLWLGLYTLLVLLFLAALIFSAVWSRIHTGLWKYGTFGDVRYFVFQYLPTLLGIILLLWLFQVEIALYRIAPFIAMASDNTRQLRRSRGAALPMYPTGFLLPALAHFRAHLPIIGLFFLTAWLSLFTIPLLASSFNVHYIGAPSAGHWRWIATQGVIWTVIALYILLLAALIMLLIYLRRATTGLLWDPKSLADMAVLLAKSNALDSDPADDAILGYWTTTTRPHDVLYTYGTADKQARNAVRDQRGLNEKMPPPVSRFSQPDAIDPESGRPISHGNTTNRRSKSPILRNGRHSAEEERPNSLAHSRCPLPWFLHLSAALLWAIIAVVLLLAFLIVSYLPSTAVASGFAPDVPAPVNRMGFSSDNFLYSFLPAFLGLLCLLFWIDIDLAYRRLQPYTSLASSPDGVLAERSLLLSYPASKLGLVSLEAALNGHFRVAWLSFNTLIAAAVPILAGGVFWAQFYVPTQSVRISAHLPGYYALTVLVTLYALSYLLAFPPKALRTLHIGRAQSFADIMRILRHISNTDAAFDAPGSKPALVSRLLGGHSVAAPVGQHAEAAGSKMSLADSIRGFGRARPQAAAAVEPGRYVLVDGAVERVS